MSAATTIYLGCYTDEAHPNGLKTLSLDEATGRMEVVAEYPVSNALYQALSPDGKWLYSCTGEGLAAFSRQDLQDSQDFSKSCQSCQSCLKNYSPECICHVAAMPDGKRVVFADYLGGFAGSVAVEDGKFGEIVIHQHEGSGPNLPRQNAAHCHEAVPLPDGSGYCVVDLGLDELVEYPSGCVFKTFPAGAGPRHILFHPNGHLAFLVYELGNKIASLSWNPDEGFRTLDILGTLEKDVHNLAAAIRFTPDGRHVVVSNRGENSLVVFSFDEATGRLAFKSRTFLAGNWPRDFIFVTDSLALVACERSGEVLAMRYDASTGVFSQIAVLSDLFRPVVLTVGML